jgi:DNA-binding NtrC family response regulator/tetratricopeptide (TPR) repeat protein
MARTSPTSLHHQTDRILGNYPAIEALRAQIRYLASFDAVGHHSVPTVLLYGETGTGKGLVARVIHDSGPRAQRPFLDVNCAAIPETLLEAELFGYEAGAFTDARRVKPGLFEAASEGTLFLDEIDALPLPLQGKLLTAIEEKRVRRVGAVVAQAVDVKLIAATQADLSSSVAAGRFRADLYHRLAVIVLALPPLREREDDVILLAEQWLRQYAEGHGLAPKRLSGAAEAWLRDYRWTGNVRELAHLIERVTLLSQEAIIDPTTLERLCLQRPSAPPESRLAYADRALPDEAARIAQALSRTGGNVVRAARLLGMSRDAVRYRVRKYGIVMPIPRLSPAVTREEPDAGDRTQLSNLSTPTFARRPAQAPERVAPPAPIPPQCAVPLVPMPGEPQALIPSWEQKPVAVLALELTWPVTMEGEAPHYEPWTATRRWEQAILETVKGFDGVLLQRSPSLLLFAFGIPHTLEQLPQRAVQAALALRQLVAAMPAGECIPELRQAAHWGQLFVDVEASDPSARLLSVGETLAQPVRMLDRAMPGGIVVSSEVSRLVEGWFELRAHQELPRDERPDRAGTCTVVGYKAHGSPLRMYRQRPLSRFVGRAEELTALKNLLTYAESGRGQVVGIVGEPGVGKSRLCYEFIRGHSTHGWLLLETSADSYGQAIPYLPVIDLLKSYFQIAGRDDVSTLRDKVTDKLHTPDQSLESSLPALLTLLDVPVEEAAWQALDPPQRRQRIMDAVKHLLLRESQVQPLCLVVENLHWIDGETQAFLDSFVESLPAARVLLLASYRPDYQHSWVSKTYYTQLRLDPLPPASAQALANSILGRDTRVMPLTRRLIELTEGNPLFLEESIQTLVETRALTGERGAYRLTQALQHLQVPATVHMVLAARIDRLPVEGKRLLQIAAVIGKEVPFSLLQAVVELPAEALRQGLAQLQRAEFLYESSLFPELAYTFKHALTHEVAYGSLRQEQRRALHARIIGALEVLYADRLAEQVGRLAHHALRGEGWEKAVLYCRQIGAKAQYSGAFREAAMSFEQALDALGHLPEHPDAGVLGIELRRRLGGMLSLVGEHARSLALLGEAAARARQLGDRARLGEVLSRMVTVRLIVGDLDGAMAAGGQALELAATLGDPVLHVHASYRLGQAYAGMGDYSRAAEMLRGNVQALARNVPGEMRLWCISSQAWLARVLSELGEFAEGRRHGEAALRLAMMEGQWQRDTPISTRDRLGHLYLAQGDLGAAIQVLEQGLALCRASGHISIGVIAGDLGEAYAHMGGLAEGLALLEEARRSDLRTGALGDAYLTHLRQLSAVYLRAGRFDDAWQHACQALDLARQQKARGDEARALFQLGAVHAHASPPDAQQAEARYQEALTRAEALGMRPLLAHCRLGLGTLYSTIGQREQARAELSAAIDLYRAMDMTFWLPHAEAALAQAQ